MVVDNLKNGIPHFFSLCLIYHQAMNLLNCFFFPFNFHVNKNLVKIARHCQLVSREREKRERNPNPLMWKYRKLLGFSEVGLLGFRSLFLASKLRGFLYSILEER